MNKNSLGLWVGSILSVAVGLAIGVAASKQLGKELPSALTSTSTSEARQASESEPDGTVVKVTDRAVWLQLERPVIVSGSSREKPKPQEDGGTPPPKLSEKR